MDESWSELDLRCMILASEFLMQPAIGDVYVTIAYGGHNVYHIMQEDQYVSLEKYMNVLNVCDKRGYGLWLWSYIAAERIVSCK